MGKRLVSVLVSVSDEGDQVPAVMPGEEGGQVPAVTPAEDGWVTAATLREGGLREDGLREDGRWPAARLRAEQPVGAVFALGWVMAELFDPPRRVRAAARPPPLDP